MEIRITISKLLGFGLPLLLFGCANMQQISDDEIYRMKSPDIPLDANLLDETSYETYKFRRDQKIPANNYYSEIARPSNSSTGIRPLLIGSPWWTMGNSLFLVYSHPFYNNYYVAPPVFVNDLTFRQPRAKAVGFTAGTQFTKPNIVTTPNNHNVYGTNPVYVKPSTSKPSFKPEKVKPTTGAPRNGGISTTQSTSRSIPTTTVKTSPGTKSGVGGSVATPRSSGSTPKAGGRKF